ncbi:MAG: hypothetical protein OER92_04405, partial [Alphaproteobacteria bacterium]|nr:hypothetical protein [Alphaproteobacteria bacterium]
SLIIPKLAHPLWLCHNQLLQKRTGFTVSARLSAALNQRKAVNGEFDGDMKRTGGREAPIHHLPGDRRKMKPRADIRISMLQKDI